MEADIQVEELKVQLYSPLVPHVWNSYSPVCLFRHRLSTCLSLFCSSCVSFSFSPARESLLTTVLTHSLRFLLSKTAKALSHCLVQLLFLPARMRKQKKPNQTYTEIPSCKPNSTQLQSGRICHIIGMKLGPKWQHEDSSPQVKWTSLYSILEHAMDL